MTTFGAVQNFIASVGPYFLRNAHIGAFLESVAITYDQNLQSLDFGLRLSQPLRCDLSALPVLSRDRRVRLYPSEPEASKRYRLTQWNQLARQAGTHIGELKNSQPYFYPDVPLMRIVHQDGLGQSATWHTLDASGNYSRHKQVPSNWNWDNRPSKWSRWWVICYAPTRLCTVPRYGDDIRYGSGVHYAGAQSGQIARDLIDMVLEVKGAHSSLRGYIIATDPTSFDPTAAPVDSGLGWTSLPNGDWAQPVNATTGKRTRPPSAIWIYDRRTS